MPRYKNTDAEIIEAVRSSISYCETLRKLGRNPNGGGGYETLHNHILRLNLDTKHFTSPTNWNKGKKFGPKRPIEDYISNKRRINSLRLKIRLLKDKIKEYKCEHCGLSEWLGQPIPLELHHKNGIRNDNTLTNLEIICPNCHSFTDTFCSKNKKK